MKYIKNPDGELTVFDEESESYAALVALPKERRPVFLDETDPLVIAHFASMPSQKSIDAKKVDEDVDLIYEQAVGNRSLEYTTAEQQALAYKTAGYTGAVPPSVASWVVASGLKANAASDNILAQAAAWRGAVEAIRANRLLAKKRITDGVPTAMAQWNGFVAAIRGQLGLEP